MTTHEISRDQMYELKLHFLYEEASDAGERISWSQISNADELVPDELMHMLCEGTEFTDDDFYCTVGRKTA